MATANVGHNNGEEKSEEMSIFEKNFFEKREQRKKGIKSHPTGVNLPVIIPAKKITPIIFQPSQTEIEIEKISEICHGLYLGNMENAKIMKDRVGAILNITPVEFTYDIAYLSVPIDDTWHQSISTYFDKTYKFIEENLEKGVYVHCHKGVSRSATIVIAYMMRKNNMTLKQAYDHVKTQRPCISPNLDFMGHLLVFEKSLNITEDNSNFFN